MEKEEALQDGVSKEKTLSSKVASLESQVSSLNAQLEQYSQQNVAKQQSIESMTTTHTDLSKKFTQLQESHAKLDKEVRMHFECIC